MEHLNLEAITAAAERHAGAAYTLGVYLAKRGRYAEAVGWLQRAAETHIGAQLGLGILYAEAQDYALALHWFRAAGQFNPYAQYNVGVIYMKGLGVPQNKSRAVKWFKRAAAQNHAKAIDVLKRLAS